MLAGLVSVSAMLSTACPTQPVDTPPVYPPPDVANCGAFLKASNTIPNVAPHDGDGVFFGAPTIADGDTVVVGAQWERGTSAGINGDDQALGGFRNGAIYVFVCSGGSWTQQAYIKPPHPVNGGTFGQVLAFDGDTIAARVPFDDSVSNPNSAGAVIVYHRAAGVWSQQAILTASNPDIYDAFGASIAIDGDTMIVGASNEDSAARTVGGDESDNSSPDQGAAYVFTRSGDTWTQQAYLKASNGESVPQLDYYDPGDHFGSNVALDGDTAVVCAYGEDSDASGVDGDQFNNNLRVSGAAYVFVRSNGTWSQQAYLKAADPGEADLYCDSLDLDGDTVVIGAYWEDGSARRINGDPTDNSSPDSGAAYVYVRSGATWSEQAYLKSFNSDPNDAFGYTVDVRGDTIAVGAPGEASKSRGVNGDAVDDSLPGAGAVYLFHRTGSAWVRGDYVKSTKSQKGDGFGSVSLGGGRLTVGAAGEDSVARGVNGDQRDDTSVSAGAVYVFSDF